MNTAESQKQVAKMNLLLSGELGSLSGTEGTFAWKWADDLKHTVQSRDLEGRPQFDHACICGVNVAVHGPECKMVTARMRTERIFLAPHLLGRWLLCRWQAPPSEGYWKEVYGSLMDYPRAGVYIPLSSGPTELCLRPGITPDERLTWLIIHTVRSVVAPKEVIASQQARDAREAQRAVILPSGETIFRPENGTKWWDNHDRVKDRLTSFGQVPGTKMSTSYPSPSLSEEKGKSTTERLQ